MKSSVAALALFLGACATPYVATPYDREIAQVDAIVLLDDSLPEEAVAEQATSVGSNVAGATAAQVPIAGIFIAAAVAAAETTAANGRKKVIMEAFDDHGLDAEAVFENALINALEGEDYVVSMSGEAREKRVFHEDYPEGEAGQAHLDVVFSNYGYQRPDGNTPWRPFADVQVRLVDAADPNVVHMDNRIQYNSLFEPEGIVTISPDVEYAFEQFDDLEADLETMVTGMEEALVEVAKTVATLLK